MMTANEIYRELGKVGSWAKESRKVRWLAARYYSGADQIEDLKAHAHADDESGAGAEFRPLLTTEQVRMIIDLR